MTTAFERLQQALRKLPGVGYRSSERIALHLLIGKPEQVELLVAALQEASRSVRRCKLCGNLSEGESCDVCTDPRRDRHSVCVVENVPDLVAIERSGSWRSVYHVLHGRLSPLNGVGPDDLNISSLIARIESGEIDELAPIEKAPRHLQTYQPDLHDDESPQSTIVALPEGGASTGTA